MLKALRLAKKKIYNKKRLCIIIMIFCMFIGILCFQTDSYATYITMNAQTKTVGTMMHKKEHIKDTYYLSLYYPNTAYPVLNEAVQQYTQTIINQENNTTTMQIYSIDYDIQMIFDSYVSLTFHKIVYNEEKEIITSEDVSYNYDIVQEKLLTTNDVVRRNYIHHLQELAKTENLDVEITKDTLSSFIITEKEITFYFHHDCTKTLSLPYEEHKAYIKLQHEQISSYYQAEPLTQNEQPAIDTNKKMIAFTFDDGPHPIYTKKIIDAFAKYNGRATFFMLGQNVKKYPDIVKDVYQQGHEIANHSWDHSFHLAASQSNPMKLQEVIDNIYQTNDIIYQLLGVEPTLFRPPYGAINQTLKEACEMSIVLWDVDSRDWESHNPKKIKEAILQGVADGNQVILLHDIHKETIDGVLSALKQLYDDGYQFVTVSTLLNSQK